MQGIDRALYGLHAIVRASAGSARRVHLSRMMKRKVDGNIRVLRKVLPSDAFRFDLSPARAFLAAHFGAYADARWHLMYGAATSRHEAAYVPEDLFYVWIVPRLNPPDRVSPYVDKNLSEILGVVPAPATYARVIRGRLVGANRRPLPFTALEAQLGHAPDVVLKPARNARQGRSVHRGSGAETLDRLHLLRAGSWAGDWVIQAAIDQHPSLARLNPSSVNTFRVLTLRVDDAIHVLSTVLRVGRAGAVVDNLSAGGLAVAVADDGALAPTAYFLGGIPTDRHPDHGYQFGTVRVPATAALAATCREAHEAIPELDMVAWDAAIRADDTVVILEANVAEPGISIHQLCTGPLFGAWTDQVLRPFRVRLLGPWLR